MAEALMNRMRQAAHEVLGGRATTRHGLITSYDPDAYAVKVALQPEGTLTGWIPLKSPWIGNGWGLFAGPSIGDAIEVDFQEADGGVGSAGHRFFNDEDRPLPVPSGEFWLIHKSGASFKLTNDGAATFSDGQGALVRVAGGQVSSTGAWSHQGAFTVTGGDVVADGISLKTHHTTGVKAGTDLSGVPQ